MRFLQPNSLNKAEPEVSSHKLAHSSSVILKCSSHSHFVLRSVSYILFVVEPYKVLRWFYGLSSKPMPL